MTYRYIIKRPLICVSSPCKGGSRQCAFGVPLDDRKIESGNYNRHRQSNIIVPAQWALAKP